MKEAIAARRAAQAEESIFQVETITDDTNLASVRHPGVISGRVTCSLPFGVSLIALRAVICVYLLPTPIRRDKLRTATIWLPSEVMTEYG